MELADQKVSVVSVTAVVPRSTKLQARALAGQRVSVVSAAAVD